MRCAPGAAACRMAALLLPESARFIAARSRMLFLLFHPVLHTRAGLAAAPARAQKAR